MKKLVLILCLLLLVTGCGKEKREPVDYGNEAQKIISTSSKKVKVRFWQRWMSKMCCC